MEIKILESNRMQLCNTHKGANKKNEVWKNTLNDSEGIQPTKSGAMRAKTIIQYLGVGILKQKKTDGCKDHAHVQFHIA